MNWSEILKTAQTTPPPRPPEFLNPLSDADLQQAVEWMGGRGYRPVDPESYKRLCACIALAMKGRLAFGIWLFGKPGCGKTMFFKQVLEETVLLSAGEVCDLFCSGGEGAVRAGMRNCWGSLCIDDLGTETRGNYYGVQAESLAIAIEERYRMFNEGGRPITSITTNLDPSELMGRYGGRVVDRLYEMTLRIEISAKSQRTALFLDRSQTINDLITSPRISPVA